MIVTHVLGLVTVQDLGRPGHMHEGLPRGGALVPEILVRANRIVRNADDAAAIEVLGALTVRATAAIETSHGDLAAGDELTITSEPRRVAYLGVRGGVAAPVILGSRSVQLSAGIGAPLRAGATIAADDTPPIDAAIPELADGPIHIVPGPDHGDVAALVANAFTISPRSDRIGTRLDGPRLAPRPSNASRPMCRGAIELPPDGQPIVLGPEHPTTGGYPVIAVIAHADLGRFFATRLGGTVRFSLGSRAPAHRRA